MREPSSLTMTLDSLPSMTATTLLVVPRSIPMIFPMWVLRIPNSEGRARPAMFWGGSLLLVPCVDFCCGPRVFRTFVAGTEDVGQANHTESHVNSVGTVCGSVSV